MSKIEKCLYNPILFDLDGTLIDSGKDIAVSVNLTRDELGLPRLPEPEIIGFVGHGVRELLRQSISRQPNPSQAQVEHAVRLFKRHYSKNCLVHTKPYPGVVNLLAALQGRMIAVVTNKRSDFTKTILEGLKLSPLVDAIVAGDETDLLKPHPEPLLLACRRMRIPPTQGIMIGDMANDVQAGKRAKMATCAVLWGLDQGRSLPAAQPDFTCDTIDELRRIIL